MRQSSFISHSPEETQLLGKYLGGLAQGGDVFLLNGSLGAGKTCLTQGIAWLEPGGAQTGPVVTRWRIRVNSITLEGINDL